VRQRYLDIAVDDVLAMAEVEGVGDGEDDLRNLALIGAAVEIVVGVEFSALAVLHDDVEEGGVVVDLVDLDDVGVLQLSGRGSTKSRISHSFM
jgi:hypothetical protein